MICKKYLFVCAFAVAGSRPCSTDLLLYAVCPDLGTDPAHLQHEQATQGEEDGASHVLLFARCVRWCHWRVSRHPQLLGRRGHGHRHGQNRRAEDGRDARRSGWLNNYDFVSDNLETVSTVAANRFYGRA